jgi:peptidoglycan/LPS O-acetylase OafA/YrhL
MASVDLTRFILALSIMLFHFRNFLPFSKSRSELEDSVNQFPASEVLEFFYINGDFAVPMFWAISGAVIAFTYSSGNQNLSKFLASRFARLYPLHILTLIVVLIIQIYWSHKYGTYLIYEGNNWKNFILHLLFMPGFTTTSSYGFNAPIWSVSVEMLTYVIYGVLCIKLKLKSLNFALSFLILMQFCFIIIGRHPAFLCLSYFSIGVIAFEMRKLQLSKIFFLLLILLLSNLITGRPSFLMIATWSVTFLNIVASIKLPKLIRTSRKSNFLGWGGVTEALGNLTYGIYLWHIPTQMFLIAILTKLEVKINKNSLLFTLPIWIMLTLLVSLLTFRYFERPVKRKILRYLIP